MKKNQILFIFLLFSLFPVTGLAQTIGNTELLTQPLTLKDTIKKKIYDHADYRVFYTMTFSPDSNRANERIECLTLLKIGKRCNSFKDYSTFLADSVTDNAARKGMTGMQFMGLYFAARRKQAFYDKILLDNERKEDIVQTKAGLDNYQYTEPMPQLTWTPAPGDSLIAGYHCKKATTRMFGRNYVAWYAPEVPLPFGPYKFSGLPGLIFSIRDVKNNYNFTLAGLEKAPRKDYIYVALDKKIIPTTRKDERKIYKNYCANPGKALLSTGRIILDPKDGPVPSKPYNPIELE